jgi:hypothetical protein
MEQRDDRQLSGENHMDGAYVNGHIREKNKKEDRVDRRLAENQRPDKRCVFVMSQRAEIDQNKTIGGVKTLTFVIKSEFGRVRDCESIQNFPFLSLYIVLFCYL